jgi:hypothetical protein
MVKSKTIKPEGQLLTVEDNKKPEIIEVSFSQAKQLAKKPMTEKQNQHVQKMVEMNRIKWQAQKEAKEAHYKKLQDEEDAKTKVLVKPKRIYPPRKSIKNAPKNDKIDESEEEIQLESSEESSEDESSEEEVYQKKPVKPSKQQQHQQVQQVQQVQQQHKPQVVSRYNGLMKGFFGF